MDKNLFFRPIVAPLMTSFDLKYSTYYTNNDGYFDSIYNRQNIGCFKVDGLNDCLLIDLNATHLVDGLFSNKYEINGDDKEISFVATKHSKL